MLAGVIAEQATIPPPSGGGIAFVGSRQNSNTSGALTVSLTGLTGGSSSTPSPGDIVLLAVSFGATGNGDITVSSSGWTEISDLYANDSRDINFGLFYKIMSDPVDTSVTFGGTNPRVAIASVWSGVDQTTPLDVTKVEATGANSGVIDPPAITPTTTGAKVIAAGGATNVSAATDTLSSDLDNFVWAAQSHGSFRAYVGIGKADWTAGSYNPSSWGGSVSVDDTWAATTIALRPAA